MKRFLSLLALLAFIFSAQAQTMLTTSPNASQKALVGQTVGTTDMYVSYHRPAAKDREIWGNLVPYGQVWRAGANENTVIKFTKEVTINGEKLAAGKYGFHILPKSETEAILIFSKNHTSWGSYSYSEKEDALRVAIQPQKAAQFAEFLTYSFDNPKPEEVTCTLTWGNQQFAFQVGTDVHKEVLATMRNELRDKAGWTWQGWNEAANYCLQNNTNTQEGLGWATRSVFMSPNSQNMLVHAKLVSMSKTEKPDNQEIILNTLDDGLKKHNVTWKEYQGAATYAMKQENWDKALEWSNSAISMSSNMTTLMGKAKILETKGDEKAAKKVRTEAIAKGTNAELNLYAYQLMWSGKTAEAVKIFEANVEKNGDDPNTWDSLGEGYYTNGQKDKAAEAFQKCLSMDPPSNVRGNSEKFLRMMGVEPKAKP